jgi:hypothetical protein
MISACCEALSAQTRPLKERLERFLKLVEHDLVLLLLAVLADVLERPLEVVHLLALGLLPVDAVVLAGMRLGLLVGRDDVGRSDASEPGDQRPGVGDDLIKLGRRRWAGARVAGGRRREQVGEQGRGRAPEEAELARGRGRQDVAVVEAGLEVGKLACGDTLTVALLQRRSDRRAKVSVKLARRP